MKIDEMTASCSAIKRKEISWEDSNYLDKVHVRDMGVRSQVCMLEGKASIGPCFQNLAPNVGPSGIYICVPKKSPKYERADCNPIPSVLNINVSKKCFPTKSKSQVNHTEKAKKSAETEIKAEYVPGSSFLGEVRLKLENLTCKLINVFNI